LIFGVLTTPLSAIFQLYHGDQFLSTASLFISSCFKGFVNYQKGALDSQPQVITFTSCLPMVGGSVWVLWLRPPLKLVTMI
jgi:hypothetical protein